MIEYRDQSGNLYFTGEFLKPNIIKVVAYVYRSGTVNLFLKDLIQLMNEFLEPGAKYHTIWTYKDSFYDGNMFTKNDLDESLVDLKLMAAKWDRISSINVLTNDSIGRKINDAMAKEHLKESTHQRIVETEKEAFQLVSELNKALIEK